MAPRLVLPKNLRVISHQEHGNLGVVVLEQRPCKRAIINVYGERFFLQFPYTIFIFSYRRRFFGSYSYCHFHVGYSPISVPSLDGIISRLPTGNTFGELSVCLGFHHPKRSQDLSGLVKAVVDYFWLSSFGAVSWSQWDEACSFSIVDDGTPVSRIVSLLKSKL